MLDTKQKILDAAERLFGENGYSVTSLRQVITEAGVNLAAVHYHFGSKEDLLDAVVSRKVGPVTQARLELLAQAEAAAGSGPPDVERVLESFLRPPAEMGQTNPTFVKLMGRMFSEGLMPHIVKRHFQESGMLFVGALGRALPHLGREELLWRVHFMIGAMAHTLTMDPILPATLEPLSFPLRTEKLVRFLGAAFRAPSESKEK
jgi:AcrR family transcriptional regulator